jgi:AcrR family transcriptional regulator
MSRAPDVKGRRTRWDAHRRQRRQEMIDAAVAVIRRRGAAVTMDDIAAEAGVAKPILYRVFRDKAELYRAVGSSVADGILIPALAAQLERNRHPREHAAAMIDTYLELIEAEPELYRFVCHPALDERPVAPDLVATYKQAIAAHLSRVIGTALRGAGHDSGAAEPWAHALVGLVHEAGDWWIEQRTMTRADLAAYLTDLVWGGFVSMFERAGVDAASGVVAPYVIAGDA